MAVAIAKQTTPAATGGSGNTVTFSGAPIGTASNDRMVVVTPSSEDATAGAVTRVTVGGIPLVQCVPAQFGAMNAAIWWGSVPTGTTADIVVTYTGTAPVSGSNRISIFAVTGADVGLATFGSHTSTDMDVSAPLTLATTIPASGAVIAVACGATSSSAAKAWGGNITEAEEVAATNYCHTTATGTTAGATTITCTGGTNQEDGALAVAVFRTASGKPQNRQSYWPLPKDVRHPQALVSWANELNIPLYTPPPGVTYLPSVATWGPPPPDARHPNVLQTWANELNLPLNTQAPFSKRDWPLPQGFATKGGAWINPAIKAAAEAPVDYLPSVASGWPIPKAAKRANALLTWSNGLPPPPTLPFSKTSWPNPRTAKRSNALLTWSNGLPPIQFVFRAPLIARRVYQSWHVALKPQPVNILPLTPVVVDTTVYLPSVASGWSTPAGLPPLNQSFTRPLSLPLNVVAVAAPFSKTDWTVPGRSPPTRSFTLAYSLPLNTVVPVPFNQLSWPNPREPERSAAHRAWVYSAPPVPDLNVYLPSAVSAWPVPRGLRPLHLQILIGNSDILLNPPEVVVPPEPDFPPHPPPTDSGGAGVKSGVWKPGQRSKRENYRSYRFITEKEIEQLTGREIRQSARDLRADVRKDDPLAEEIAKEIAALSRIVDVLADMDRLESSVAELSRAIEYALRARAEAEADDEEVSFLLLS